MDKNRVFTATAGNGTSGAPPADQFDDENAFRHPGSNQDGVRNKIGKYGIGWNWGINSGDIEPSPQSIETIGNCVEAIANADYGKDFDPDNSLSDKRREERFERWQEQLHKAEQASLNEESKLKEAEITAAQAWAAVPQKPVYPVGVVAVGIPLITLTVTFAIYDSFVTAFGFILALTFTLLMGLAWGSFVIFLILHNFVLPVTGRSRKTWLGLVCVIGMAIALGIIRFNQSSSEFLWFVIAFTLLEVFIVLGIDSYSQLYREELREYQVKSAAANQADSILKATKSESIRRQQREDRLENKTEAHNQYLDNRKRFAVPREQFVASLKSAEIADYCCACAYNKGRGLI